MRLILILWAIPVILFWGWYALSANDMHFGMFFLERGFHDLIFNLYSNILGMPAAEIPGLLAWVFFIDTLLVLGLAALRWYKFWLPQTLRWCMSRTGFEAATTHRVYSNLMQFTPIWWRNQEPVEAGRVQPAE